MWRAVSCCYLRNSNPPTKWNIIDSRCYPRSDELEPLPAWRSTRVPTFVEEECLPRWWPAWPYQNVGSSKSTLHLRWLYQTSSPGRSWSWPKLDETYQYTSVNWNRKYIINVYSISGLTLSVPLDFFPAIVMRVHFEPGGEDWNALRPMWIHSGENDRRLEFHWFVWVRDHSLLYCTILPSSPPPDSSSVICPTWLGEYSRDVYSETVNMHHMTSIVPVSSLLRRRISK